MIESGEGSSQERGERRLWDGIFVVSWSGCIARPSAFSLWVSGQSFWALPKLEGLHSGVCPGGQLTINQVNLPGLYLLCEDRIPRLCEMVHFFHLGSQKPRPVEREPWKKDIECWCNLSHARWFMCSRAELQPMQRNCRGRRLLPLMIRTRLKRIVGSAIQYRMVKWVYFVVVVVVVERKSWPSQAFPLSGLWPKNGS